MGGKILLHVLVLMLAAGLLVGCTPGEVTRPTVGEIGEESSHNVASEGLGNDGKMDKGEVAEKVQGEVAEKVQGEVAEKVQGPAGVKWNVQIRGLTLLPRVITIAKGDTVVWHNDDEQRGNEVEHMLASHQNLFRSKRFGKGESFTYVFNESGTFTYFDVIFKTRDFLRGTVNVQ